MTDWVGFAPEPNGRGTFGIIWSCLPTIFLATWTPLHIRAGRSNPLRSKIIMWLGALLVPETIVTVAVLDHRCASIVQRGMRGLNRDGWERFSLKQAFLVRHSAVVLRWRDRVDEIGNCSRNKCSSDSGSSSSSPPWHEAVARENLWQFTHTKRITYADFPSDDAIRRRSKADGLSKILAILQSLWFVLTLVTRLAQSGGQGGALPVSLLECMTVAYVCCGLILYVVWLACPHNVEEPFVVEVRDPIGVGRGHGQRPVRARDTPTPTIAVQEEQEEKAGPVNHGKIEAIGRQQNTKLNLHRTKSSPPGPYPPLLVATGTARVSATPLPSHLSVSAVVIPRASTSPAPISSSASPAAAAPVAASPMGQDLEAAQNQTAERKMVAPLLNSGRMFSDTRTHVVVQLGILAVFAAIHLAAWNYPFPTATEAWLWRCSSLGTFVFGAIVVHPLVAGDDDEDEDGNNEGKKNRKSIRALRSCW